ncbi:MAG TPA: hypothetical protein PLI95_17490 [Polyangiaceae bacterium]|nr:hypothetical protein [Polyangiaceae bacterium]
MDRESPSRLGSGCGSPARRPQPAPLPFLLVRIVRRPLRRLAFLGLASPTAAYTIFGNDAFRKRTSRDDPRKPISKALFEAWAVNLDGRPDEEIALLTDRRDKLRDAFIHLMVNDKDFAQAPTSSASSSRPFDSRGTRRSRPSPGGFTSCQSPRARSGP